MPRRPNPPPPQPPDWPPAKTYAALKKQLQELDRFRGQPYRRVQHDETAWKNLTLNILTHGFGENSNNVQQFYAARSAGRHHMNMSEGEIQHNFGQRIEAFTAMLNSTLAELELMIEHTVEAVPAQGKEARTVKVEAVPYREGTFSMKSDSREVFLVHGHDEGVKQSVARFLEKLGLHPIILHEQANRGRTLIEKFEENSDVGFAVVLLTPDDIGASKSAADKLTPRARQNVILELGYFIGKLRRARVCALYVEGVELPSDINGVLYVPYDANCGWQLKLANEIKAAGIDVDLNKAAPSTTPGQ